MHFGSLFGVLELWEIGLNAGSDGYFEQFGRCMTCPPTTGASAGAMVGIAAALVFLGVALYSVRQVLPVDVLKLGLSMLQVGTLQLWV
jgi:hypothetical protein